MDVREFLTVNDPTEYCALDSEFGGYLAKIKENLKNISGLRSREQNNVCEWIERLSSRFETPRQKIIRNEYAQLLSHLLKRGRIEYPFSELPPSFGRLKPLHDVIYTGRTNKFQHSAETFDSFSRETETKAGRAAAGSSTMTASRDPAKFPTERMCSFHPSEEELNPNRGRSYHSDYRSWETFADGTNGKFCCYQSDSCKSCDAHQFLHEEVQHIRLSPRQRRKLSNIQEEQKKTFDEKVLSTEDVDNSKHFWDQEKAQEKSRSESSQTVDKVLETHYNYFSNRSSELKDSSNNFDFSKKPFNRTSAPSNLQSDKQRGGTTDSVSMSISRSEDFSEANDPVSNQLTKEKTVGSASGRTSVGSRTSPMDRLRKTKRLSRSNDDDVKSCISCGRFIKEDAACKRPQELPTYQTDLFKTIWEQESHSTIMTDPDRGQSGDIGDRQYSKILHDSKDDVQLILTHIDPDISLREFIILFSPMLVDKGELLKNVTGDEFFRFLKYVETIFTIKFERAYQMFCSKRESIVNDYAECEGKIAEQRAIFETQVKKMLPDFSWEEYLANEDYLRNAIEAAKVKLPTTESGFQDARKRQHAELQNVKNEIEKLKKENLALKTQIESPTQGCPDYQQGDVKILSNLLNKLKAMVQTATDFHQELGTSSIMILDLVERRKENPEKE